MRRLAKILVAALLIPFGGACGHSASLAPMAASYTGTPVARVDIKEVEEGLVKLMVYNTSTGVMVISRDDFVLQTPEGILKREPGGIASTYEVQPGGFHDVNLKYDTDKLKEGVPVYLLVDPAIRINGQCVGLQPLMLMVK